MIAVIDYRLGNLHSIRRALRHVGGEVVVTDDPDEISKATHLILPGVGAFGEGISNLREKGLVEPIVSFASSGRPILGICLGMQLFMSTSEEGGIHKGLDLIKGEVVRIPDVDTSCKIPHIGWGALEPGTEGEEWDNTLLKGIHDGDYVYFVHSYVVIQERPENILATTVHGGYRFCSVVKRDNIYGCQFHPEKSGEEVGLRILSSFIGTN